MSIAVCFKRVVQLFDFAFDVIVGFCKLSAPEQRPDKRTLESLTENVQAAP